MPGRREVLQTEDVTAPESDAASIGGHLRSLDLNLRLAVSLRYELGFNKDEASFVMGIDSEEVEDLVALGLKRLHLLLAQDGLERLPAEIGEMIKRLPPAPVPERLKAWLGQLVGLNPPGAEHVPQQR